MLLLVLYGTLNLVLFTRCSLVFDEHNQEAQKNKYCSKVGDCLPGTHVMCMYENPAIMGPRCIEGKPLPLDDTERELFLDIFNGFRRDLASGQEVFGKDGIRLPQAQGMRKLSWDNDLATFAQAWANQCELRLDWCRSMDRYPSAGQMVGIFRFSLYWDYPNKIFIDKTPGLTLEKRKCVIEDFAKIVFSTRTSVTLDMIENFLGSEHDNVYLMSVYGSSSHIGCAMSTYVEYLLSFYDTNNNHAVFVVCNFSSRPQKGEKVYMTKGGACKCPEGFYNDNCLCDLVGEKGEKQWQAENMTQNEEPSEKGKSSNKTNDTPNERENNTKGESPQKTDDIPKKTENNTKGESPKETDDISKNKENNKKGESPSETRKVKKGDEVRCRARAPVVVVLPIITVENADPKMHQLHQSQRENLATIARRRLQLSKKIKRRTQDARNYFREQGFEPGTRTSNGGTTDQVSFVIPKFDLDHTSPIVNRKNREVELTFPNNLHIQIKPELGITELDQHLLHKRQNPNEGNLQADEADQIFNGIRNNEVAKVSVTSINGKPVKFPFENFQKSQMLNSRTLPSGIEDLSNRGESNIYITSINGKPVKFDYDEKFKNSQKQSTKDQAYDDGINDFSNRGETKIYITSINGKPVMFDYDETFEESQKQSTTDLTYDDGIKGFSNRGETKVYITSNNGTPVMFDYDEKFEKSQKQSTTDLAYDDDIKGFSNRGETKAYITSNNGKPVTFDYDETFGKSQKQSTTYLAYDDGIKVSGNRGETKINITPINGKLRKFYHDEKFKKTQKLSTTDLTDMQSFSNKVGPYISSEQLLSGFYIPEQKLKDILYNTYINEIIRKSITTTREDNTNKDNMIKSTKQIKRGDFTDKTSSKSFATDDNDSLNINKEEKTMEVEIDNWPTRNQVPLHIHAYGTEHFDYYKHFHATNEYIKPRATILYHEHHGRNNNDRKDEALNRKSSNREQNRPLVYDINKSSNYYLDMLKHIQHFKRHYK